MVFDNQFLNQLTAQARISPRLRQHYDLRDSEKDQSQRMLNAIEPGTVIPIHRHTGTSEEVVVLRGQAEEVFFDDQGHETGRWLLSPAGTAPHSAPGIHVPMNQYHTCQSLESGTIIIEFKNTPYDPETTEDFL